MAGEDEEDVDPEGAVDREEADGEATAGAAAGEAPDAADDVQEADDESDRDAAADGDPDADHGEAGDPNADQDAPVTAVGWISGFAIAVLALADGNPAHVVVLGALVGVVGVATWAAIRRGRERDAFRGQVAVALVAVVGAGAALVDRALLLAAAFGLVAVMLGGRVFEKWRA